MPQLRNILVANRGEIALRIMRTLRSRGYRTTAIYSEADADAPHVAFADVAVLVGPAPVGASYLNIERVVAAALASGADAVHPGYGLLSENAVFARACAQAGLTFIGPSPETIEGMGNKRRARIAMQAAGVRCVPGYDGEAQSDEVLIHEARKLGFPIMVKAAAGGGGRGMRRVSAETELAESLARAHSEADKAFGDGRLILERVIEGARHVEVQVVSDSHGQVIHLGERDCSVQRRFQKVIEEAPSPAVNAELRQRMGEVAVLAAQRSGYIGVGTVEFLLAPGGEFYFLEMNTRLQVEHPVTELVTGLDIVALQVAIAEGEKLQLCQADVVLRGHAIEARLYAEDPEQGFVPATGSILRLTLPDGHDVRVDHALAEGLRVTSHYDAMLAKLSAHGANRDEAKRKLLHALASLRVLGVQTNQAFLCSVLEDPVFSAGHATTEHLDKTFVPSGGAPPSRQTLVAAALICAAGAHCQSAFADELVGFSNCQGVSWPLLLEHAGRNIALRVEPENRNGEVRVRVGESMVLVRVVECTEQRLSFVQDGLRTRVDYALDGDVLWLHMDRGAWVFRDITYAPPRLTVEQGSGRALAPMDGAVVDVPVKVGDEVSRGQTLAVIEAMKLELRVCADLDGVVQAVHVVRGEQVRAQQVLVEVRAALQAQ